MTYEAGMSYEAVIDHLEDLQVFNHEPTEEDKEALGIVIDILQKHIPRKPRTEHRQYICPECGTKLVTYNWSGGIHYCHHCGIAIDWENEV